MPTLEHSLEARPWVEKVAGNIGDPVQRLRFLQWVEPVRPIPRPSPRGVRWKRAALLLCCAVLAGAASLSFTSAANRVSPGSKPVPPARPLRPNMPPGAKVWRVEENDAYELYSNGLRVDRTFLVQNRGRAYLAYPADGAGPPERRTAPAGIVFHSTESMLAPFEAEHNDALRRIGESLLDYIRRRRSYHFVLDRFGRVFREVTEDHAANHAGHSTWADGRWLYVGLNDSFLGIAFEAGTAKEGEPEITPAQKRSAMMLVEMLRSRYGIPAGNCVTHAQVSVNPSNMLVGYHVDWASRFPFGELGLPDNYATPLPSVWAFGFEWDEAFRNAAGSELRSGLESAERELEGRAATAGERPSAYRKRLRERYRRMLAARSG